MFQKLPATTDTPLLAKGGRERERRTVMERENKEERKVS